MREFAEKLSDMLACLDDVDDAEKEKFREYFIEATDAEGPLEVGSALSYLTKLCDEAYL